MATDLKICGVILAAGSSSRMGRDKAMLPWPPESKSGTLLSASISALRPFVETVIAVAGNNVDTLAPVVATNGALIVHNLAPERGQFSSLQTGLVAALNHGCSAVMITPVDCPPLSSASLAQLRTAFEHALANGAWAVAPENNGRHGHPLFAARPLIDAFLDAPVTSNAREVKYACMEKLQYISVPDPLLTADLNTPEEYTRAAERMTASRG